MILCLEPSGFTTLKKNSAAKPLFLSFFYYTGVAPSGVFVEHYIHWIGTIVEFMHSPSRDL